MKTIIKHTPDIQKFVGKKQMPMIIKIKSSEMTEQKKNEFIEMFKTMNMGPALIMPSERNLQAVEFVNKKLVSRRATFVGIVDEANELMNVGVAVCNPKDQFNKKQGVMLATQNAYNKPLSIISLKKE